MIIPISSPTEVVGVAVNHADAADGEVAVEIEAGEEEEDVDAVAGVEVEAEDVVAAAINSFSMDSIRRITTCQKENDNR